MKENVRVVLVGLGPHAKRIYINYIKNKHINLDLVIDIESNKNTVIEFLKNNNIACDTYFVNDSNKNNDFLVYNDFNNLKEIVAKLGITHAIISTEPKAHKAYIDFFIRNKINVVVDKPLTAPIDVSTNYDQAQKIIDDYEYILNLYSKYEKDVILKVQCQRRWHKGYLFIHKLATEIVKKYNIPITSINMSHCDGMWNMPDEFNFRENHPYKYGYGKLFHSGYHFVDMVSWFEQINLLIDRKKFDNVDVYATCVRPSDFMVQIDKDNYHELFGTNKFDKYFTDEYDYTKYGEIDMYSMVQFKMGNSVISTATMNLIQNGFSRRSWPELPEDTYRGNGRVRHEYMNMEIGPLMNIQVHSYQSKEIKDRNMNNYNVGEVEHFDIYVFRNVDLIGGKAFEKITIKDLYDENQKEILGYNELSRENCLSNFLNNVRDDLGIEDHRLGIMIMSKQYEAICRNYHNEVKKVNFTFETQEKENDK
jgi:predicted dehydrogenase